MLTKAQQRTMRVIQEGKRITTDESGQGVTRDGSVVAHAVTITALMDRDLIDWDRDMDHLEVTPEGAGSVPPVSMRPLRRTLIAGAVGWTSADGGWQFLRPFSGHPDARRWIVRQRMEDGAWFAHDGSFQTLRDAIEYAQDADDLERALANGDPDG